MKEKSGHTQRTGGHTTAATKLWLDLPTSERRQKEVYRGVRSLAKRAGVSADHLRALLRQGVVAGTKVEGYWLTTRSAVDRFRSARAPTKDARPTPERRRRSR